MFNNIFVQMDRVPGVGFVGMTEAANVREGGNLLWGVAQGPGLDVDPFAKFRASRLFESSRQRYAPGWTMQDLVADPEFVDLPPAWTTPADLRLQSTSPAVNAGIELPADWPDPLRGQDAGLPDSGALPLEVEAWSTGVDGRRSLSAPW